MLNNHLLKLSSSDFVVLKQIAQQLNRYRAELAEQLTKHLQAVMFYNSHTLHPTRLKLIGQEKIDNFLNFLTVNDFSPLVQQGKKMAQEGLGYKSLLTTSAFLTQVCTEKLDLKDPAPIRIALRAVNLYQFLIFEGYMQEYKNQLVKEQRNFRQAFDRVKEGQKDTLV